MIFDSIKNKDNYKNFDILYRALTHLNSYNLENMPVSTIELDGKDLFLNPVTFTSKPEEECLFEVHNNYIDLHYILKGIEGIGTAGRETLTTVTPYDKSKDIAFLEGTEDGRYYLKAGQFMVCWPEDAHKPAIMYHKPEEIIKIVVKIRI